MIGAYISCMGMKEVKDRKRLTTKWCKKINLNDAYTTTKG